MAAFFEIHDSIIESLVWDGPALELAVDAVCTVSDEDKPPGYGRQNLLLCISNSAITGDNVEPEIWLLEGMFECAGEIRSSPTEAKAAWQHPPSMPGQFCISSEGTKTRRNIRRSISVRIDAGNST